MADSGQTRVLRDAPNVAVVGLGYWGPNLLRVLVERTDVHVRWICDTDIAPLERYGRRYPATLAMVSWMIRAPLPPMPQVAIAQPSVDPGPFLALKPLERIALESGTTVVETEFPRALLADFPVLVLDEPGEHLDTATADAIAADVLAASAERAIVLITHRLAGLEAVDEVIVLDAGRVAERGTHSELIVRGGAYAAMWRRERGKR